MQLELVALLAPRVILLAIAALHLHALLEAAEVGQVPDKRRPPQKKARGETITSKQFPLAFVLLNIMILLVAGIVIVLVIVLVIIVIF